jgi:hypothetical protein
VSSDDFRYQVHLLKKYMKGLHNRTNRLPKWYFSTLLSLVFPTIKSEGWHDEWLDDGLIDDFGALRRGRIAPYEEAHFTQEVKGNHADQHISDAFYNLKNK